jgi:hypothetical protein
MARRAAVIAFALIAAAPAAADRIDPGALAQCIADSGALFYGAHWCPFCRKQKESFGAYAGALPYVECYDGPKSDGKNARCEDEGIKSFPTWVFADGRRKSGVRTPQQLAADTRCE